MTPEQDAAARTVAYSGVCHTVEGSIVVRIYADQHLEIEHRGQKLDLSADARNALFWMMGGDRK